MFKNIHRYLSLFLLLVIFVVSVHAQEAAAPVEVNGDQVQYLAAENKVIATGNVIVKRQGVTLYCDRIEFDRAKNIGIAEGNVVLEREGSRLTGDKMLYNFDTMKGDFVDARITSKPFYGGGKKIDKVGDNHIILHNGYITTCDLDEPHFKLRAPKVDIYQGDKAIARRMTFVVGKVPILFIPRYTQDLRQKKPVIVFTPGYDKQWGMFILSQYRYFINENATATLHLDYRSRKGLGEGADFDYDSEKFGNGLMRIYYTQERDTDDKYFFQRAFTDPTRATIERERFKGEWRHKWDIDDRTSAIWQYYKLSDGDFLKDYFEREYENDTNPPTYFLLTRGLSQGTLSLRGDVRVNRFTSAINRLPELNYTLSSFPLGESGFYFQNVSTYSNLARLEAAPMANRYETMRLDTDNEISYPFKIKFFELRPFVGGRETFYTKTLDKADNNTIRGIFRTGSDVSTKFFRVYDVKTNALGMNINRLRHVVTPSVAYFYTHEPTLPSSKLVQFDGIDQQANSHGMIFGFENKLQTKRNGQSVDLLRLLLASDFYLKEDSRKGGFNNVRSDMDFKPNDYLTLYSQAYYDTIEEHLSSANFDLYFNDPGNRWYASIGKRYDREVDDQITTELGYRLNQKWFFRVYQRFDVDRGISKEQEYSFTRDMHEWELKASFNHKATDGDEVWLVFTLKEFPDLALDFSTGFNRRQRGAGAR